MPTQNYARQTLAAYALFNEARKRGQPLQHALLPLVLPSIAGRAGDLFVPEQLAEALHTLFGNSFNAYSAEALAPMLEVEGYLTKEISQDNQAIYLYTAKVNDLAIDEGLSQADQDVDEILDAFLDYLRDTKPIIGLSYDRENWRSMFIQWATSVDTTDVSGFERWLDNYIATDKKTPLKLAGNEEPEERFVELDRHVIVLFASFARYSSTERRDLFAKISVLVELGLIVDVVAELRAPLRKPPKKISLTPILDGPILLDILGLQGEGRKVAAECLLKLCSKHQIQISTLQHCVQEAREMVNAVLNDDPLHRSGVMGDALRVNRNLELIGHRFIAQPDKAIKERGITILDATQQNSIQERAAFDDGLLRDFAERLPYQAAHMTQRRMRDAQSVAFVMRKRVSKITSELYLAKYILVTRSPVLSRFAERFVNQKLEYVEHYAVSPVIEVRHFSTMFLLTFGGDVDDGMSRGELLASCERVMRTSPNMVRKVRRSMEQLSLFSKDELDAIMGDQVAVYEITTATGNDPELVNASNAVALAEIIRTAAAKNERLRHGRAERELRSAYQKELSEREQTVAVARSESQKLSVMLSEHQDNVELLASSLFGEYQVESDIYWVAVLIAFTIISIFSIVAIFVGILGVPFWARIIFSLCSSVVAIYALCSRLLERFSLFSFRKWLLRWTVRRKLKRNPHPMLKKRIAELAGIEIT